MTDSIIHPPAPIDNSFLGGPTDAMRAIFEHTLREIMQAEFDQHVGAGRYARSDERLDHRNGTRHRAFDTRMGASTWRFRGFAKATTSRASRTILLDLRSFDARRFRWHENGDEKLD